MLKLRTAWFSWLYARRLAAWVILMAGFLWLYTWHLGNLTPGMSPAENLARKSSQSFNSIVQDPVNAPHKLLQFGVQSLGHHGAFWMRSISVLFALIFLVCLYWLLKSWFGRRMAFFGVVLMGSTPMFVLAARNASATIMLCVPLALIASFVWLLKTKGWPNLAWIILCVVAAVASYVPGVLWLVIAGAVFGYKRLAGNLEEVSQSTLFAGVSLYLILLVPAALASARHFSVAQELLLIPSTLPGPVSIIENAAWALSSIFWKTKQHMDITLARLPMLSLAQSVLAVIGFYVLFKRVKRESFFLISIILVAVITVALGNPTHIILFSFASFSLAAVAGLRYLHMEWQGVFPRNPLPRYLALLLISVLAGLQFIYCSRYVLMAWPHSVQTKNTYVIK